MCFDQSWYNAGMDTWINNFDGLTSLLSLQKKDVWFLNLLFCGLSVYTFEKQSIHFRRASFSIAVVQQHTGITQCARMPHVKCVTTHVALLHSQVKLASTDPNLINFGYILVTLLSCADCGLPFLSDTSDTQNTENNTAADPTSDDLKHL